MKFQLTTKSGTKKRDGLDESRDIVMDGNEQVEKKWKEKMPR